jgi:hypothetical protein
LRGGFGYSVSWDSTSVPDGVVNLQAQAHDATANSAMSFGRIINVKNAVVVPPRVKSSVPTPGLTGVKRGSNITVSFTKAMDKTSLNKVNVALYTSTATQRSPRRASSGCRISGKAPERAIVRGLVAWGCAVRLAALISN